MFITKLPVTRLPVFATFASDTNKKNMSAATNELTDSKTNEHATSL
jgi:hypothetical protein